MSVFSKTRIALITMSEGIASVVGKLFADLPMDGSADPTVTRALNTATRINSAGNIETVVANRGRISYRLGTNKCPNLLVERANGNVFTNNPDTLNDYNYVGLSPTYNNHISPKGTIDATRVSIGIDGSSIRHRIISPLGFNSVTGTYILSAFVKELDHRYIQLVPVAAFANINDWANFDLQTGAVTNKGADAIAWSEPAANGYFRLFLIVRSTATVGTFSDIICAINNDPLSIRYPSYQSLAAANICYVWGANLTLGVVPFSYCSGVGNADVITKTGLSAILSGTQGLGGDCYLQAASLADSVIRTIAEVAVDANNFARISRLNNTIVGRITVGGVEQAAITYTIPAPLRDKRCKVYLDFQLNNVNLYVNGLLVGTDTLASALTGLAGTYTGQSIGSANFWDGLIKSNVQMASLDATERDKWFQYASYSEMASELLYTID
jgi:hypothetical protein